MTKIIHILWLLLGAASTSYGLLELCGLTWNEVGDLFKKAGATIIFQRPISVLLVSVGLYLLWSRYATRNRSLYVRESSMTLVFNDQAQDRTHLEIEQIVQAYADNVTAMFSTYTPDPNGGKIPENGISMWIKPHQNGMASFPSQQLYKEGSEDKGWEIRHEFGASLKPCYGIRWIHRFHRTGRIHYQNCHKLKEDYQEFCTQRYQVGKLRMAVAVPNAMAPQIKVSGILLLNFGVIQLHVNEDHNTRPGYVIYYLEHKPPRDLVAKYRLMWASP